MKESEAKEKWCPMTRYLATFRNEAGKLEAAGCFNRGGADSGLQTARCIGSECMAWRWMNGKPPQNKTSGEDWYEGYCGAFGELGIP